MTSGTDRPLTLDVRELGAAVVVAVGGSADMQDSERLRTALNDLADREVARIVVDLSDMDFICSAGLGAIIAAHLRVRHYEGSLSLVNPRPAVRELLETTRLTKLFAIHEDVDQALEGIDD